MHFVVSWDINSTGEEWTRLNDQMREKLKPYSWARPLTTFYVVQANYQETWNSILKDLTEFAQSNPSKINFLMTPLMNGGQYNGVLPGDMWEEINKRSQ